MVNGIANPAPGDTKAGTLIAKDRYGNKYYENLADELPRQSSGHTSMQSIDIWLQ
jgi:hypothetical protein